MLSSARSAAARRATSTVAGERSLEISRPPRPSHSMIANPVSPAPAANSRIVSPGCTAPASISQFVTWATTL